ncbi:diguanylate cyclase [Thiomicrospira aerophila AL3]|uniref:diguanylate cyclase n=1 Tax=Thiomicrospira aerophila AL3 TaxID=717772 RepID=W0DSZ9_9GAMM|nr:diguanylate cyclase [Thiomicrospira aerophila]AHF01715.1 diguanylate cyclase [Thiomicrospira aerophila AL3]
MFDENKPSVLIVDDEPTNAKILANGLKDDYQIMIVNSGKKALEFVKANPKLDIILLDIMMPDVDGYEVCSRLKSDEATAAIPIVFVSALNQATDEEKGLNLGAVDYISKPFHLAIVKARVKNHISLKRKNDLLAEMSHLDVLTHIANRRQFDETLVRESLRLMRSSAPLSLIMLDIDFFKQFNDFYGHGLGDLCLEKVAKAFNSVIKRPGDLLARYGGEEFAVILPETDKAGAEVVAQGLIESVAALQIKHERSEVASYVTVSAGVSSDTIESVDEALELLKRADVALYQAKKQGKNRFVTI